MQRSVLIIYTGGTIGMIEDAESRTLRPFDFDQIEEQVPELKKSRCKKICIRGRICSRT
mgnify:CR=1 FL=1